MSYITENKREQQLADALEWAYSTLQNLKRKGKLKMTWTEQLELNNLRKALLLVVDEQTVKGHEF